MKAKLIYRATCCCGAEISVERTNRRVALSELRRVCNTHGAPTSEQRRRGATLYGTPVKGRRKLVVARLRWDAARKQFVVRAA